MSSSASVKRSFELIAPVLDQREGVILSDVLPFHDLVGDGHGHIVVSNDVRNDDRFSFGRCCFSLCCLPLPLPLFFVAVFGSGPAMASRSSLVLTTSRF